MKKTLSILLALAPLIVACAPDDTDADEATEEAAVTAKTASALYGGTKVLWPMQDGKATIKVCWLPLDLANQPLPGGTYAIDPSTVIAERKQWMREGVEREWNAKTVVQFVGWQDCGPGVDADVQINPIGSNTPVDCGGYAGPTGGNCVQAIGSPVKGKKATINAIFGDEMLSRVRYLQNTPRNNANQDLVGSVFLPAVCYDQMDAADQHYVNNQPITQADIAGINAVYKDCLQNMTNHEFGHLAGFSHEQDRMDTSAACRAKYAASTHDTPGEADTPLGAWEEDSIMSYCRITLAGTLTAEDIKETNDFYAMYAPKLPSAMPKTENPVGTSSSGGDSMGSSSGGDDTDPAPTTPKKKKSAAVAPATGGCNGN
jgi:hypothetical protein